MHGLIHVTLKQLVLDKFKEEAWAAIVKEAGIEDEAAFLALTAHSDELTVAAVQATATVAGVTVDTALRLFGEFFAEAAVKGGHLRLLRSMGDSMEEFLGNLNIMHCVLERSMRTAVFPYMKIESLDSSEAKTGSTASSSSAQVFKLTYCSMRGGLLKPVLEGVLPVVAKNLFQEEIILKEVPAEKGSSGTWIVTVRPVEDSLSDVEEEPQGWWSSLAMWHTALMCQPCREKKAKHKSKKGEPAHPPTPTARRTLTLEELVEARSVYTSEAQCEDLECIQALVDEAEDDHERAAALMRAAPACEVSANWEDLEALNAASAFWASNQGKATDYKKSRSLNGSQADFFVTHSWLPPKGWKEIMGAQANYGDVKATELQSCAADFAEELGVPWQQVTLWIDKCCIPQQHELLKVAVPLIEDFVQRCNGMIVMLTWDYFTRLWCVYEWAGFLIFHDPRDVVISIQGFSRPASMPLLVDAVAKIKVEDCLCNNEADRPFLLQKVAEYYVSTEAFETFAKGTAIALVVTSLAQLGSQDEDLCQTIFKPWVQLAEDIGLHDLVEGLRAAKPLEWRRIAFVESSAKTLALGAGAKGWRLCFTEQVNKWFDSCILPVLEELKARSVRCDALEQTEVVRRLSSQASACTKRSSRRARTMDICN